MALKISLVFVIFILAASMAALAEAQLGGLGNLLGLINLQGTVFCTLNGRIGVNGTSTPVFSNALVQLQCNGNVVSSATTNNSGVFSILLNPLQFLLSSLLSDCKVVVNTPLSSCNASLPSTGALVSLIQILGNTVSGLLNIINLGLTGFNFIPNV
ncbi:Immunoglobulin-like fold containing protein [Trema orientale]|uniref:Immunoglobulin-like fold containing protein n=1 Tax=Trema orientale TaxID=63057 RepID=A0A2P5ES44_TREOI|nr:Immunoglobulin-like fold containing protein [Trema orientale]